MSEADKLFELLLYKKFDNHQEKAKSGEWTTQDSHCIDYIQGLETNDVEYSMFIRFMLDYHKIQIGGLEIIKKDNGKYTDKIYRTRNPILNMQELKAINMKCKELGWSE